MLRNLLTAIIILSFGLNNVNAQNLSRKSTRFLAWFFKTQQNVEDGKIFYLKNGLSEYQIKKLKDYISADTLIHLSQSFEEAKQNRFLVLSEKQKVYLLNEISKIKSNHIPKKIVPFMTLLEDEKLDSITKDSNRHNYWTKIYDNKIYGFYTFNAPIFFDRQYCLFQYNYNCGGLCGDGTTIIYKKTKTGWERWIELDNWIS